MYFKSFPVATATVESYGLGMTKAKLVETVVNIVKEEKDIDQETWIVFDMDMEKSNKEQQVADVQEAIELANQNDLKVAYSNDAFELWFLLHYQFIDNQWTRYEYYEKLSTLWNCNYEKEGKKHRFCGSLYSLLEKDERASQEQAIGYAEKLESTNREIPLVKRNPYTGVYLLVRALNQHIE